jgi:hypothetical protein
MSALAEALVAAQRQAVSSLTKAYVAGAFEDDGETGLLAQLERIGLNDPVDADYLRECLDVLRTYGGAFPAPNGKPRPESDLASDKQKGLIRDLCQRKNQPEPEDFELLTKKQASEAIDALDKGTYDPAKWRVPF